ncbi:unnamed protein product [Aphanomyces euteiches]
MSATLRVFGDFAKPDSLVLRCVLTTYVYRNDLPLDEAFVGAQVDELCGSIDTEEYFERRGRQVQAKKCNPEDRQAQSQTL